MLVSLTLKLIPEAVMAECRTQADGMWSDGKPKKWYYAVPIVIIWLLVLFVLLKTVKVIP